MNTPIQPRARAERTSRRTTVEEEEERAAGLPPLPAEETRLVRQLREGDPEAGRQLVRDYYAGVYRYLLYLTGRPDAAEDLTQETFLQAWRHLDSFQGR